MPPVYLRFNLGDQREVSIDTGYSRFLSSIGDAPSIFLVVPLPSSTCFDNPTSCQYCIGIMVTNDLGFSSFVPKALDTFYQPFTYVRLSVSVNCFLYSLTIPCPLVGDFSFFPFVDTRLMSFVGNGLRVFKCRLEDFVSPSKVFVLSTRLPLPLDDGKWLSVVNLLSLSCFCSSIPQLVFI